MADDLASAWNEAGRAHFMALSNELTKFYEGDQEAAIEQSDPRTEAQAEAVLAEALTMRAAGEGASIRSRFDPAYAPFLERIKATSMSLPFVTLLGAETLLVRRGAAWKDGRLWLLDGHEARELAALGACRSRKGEHLVVAAEAGLEFRDGLAGKEALEGDATAQLAWPSMTLLRPVGLDADAEWEPNGDGLDIEQMAVSDDGKRVVVSGYRQGILLGSLHEGEPDWRLLWPDQRPEYTGWGGGEDGEPRYAGDMTHVAISPDGTRLAFGCQDSDHLLFRVEGAEIVHHASAGPVSEYPHFCAFTGDGSRVALNSCHFYSGETFSMDWEWAGTHGKYIDPHESELDEHTPLIESGLRVYGGAWVDRRVITALFPDSNATGGFLLAGNGVLRCVGAKSGLGFAQTFGSSASSVDFCARSRRIAVASYSGMVHVYDSDAAELPGRIDGYRSRRECYRWLMWRDLEGGPLRW
ncbi:MAG: hypothetical protein AAF938_13665 [Myxococcota bacterium]